MHRNASRDPVCGDTMHVCVVDLESKPFEGWKPSLEEAYGMFGPNTES